ncbi:MAG: thioredoxin family protein [Gemmatimonadota bacterium]
MRVPKRHFRRLLRLATAAVLASHGTALDAQAPRAPRDPSPHSDAELISGATAAARGGTMTVAVRLTLDPHWHTYWINPGDAGLPLKVKWTLPDGITVGPLRFPTPKLTPQPPLMSYGYENEVLVLADVQVPATFAASSLVLQGKADWLACAEVCLPATGPLSLTLDVGASAGAPTQWASAIEATRQQLPAPLTGWSVRGWADSARYVVAFLRDAAGARAPFASPYLFVDSADIVDHAAPQRVALRPDTVVVEIPRGAMATATATRLAGIIATDVDAASPRGYAFDAALDAPAGTPLQARSIALLAAAGSVGGVGAAGAPIDPSADMTLVAAILFAFVGGLLLNLMPCVFPVLSVKVLALLEHGGAVNAARGRKHGLAFGLGVLLSFWALAGVLMALRAGGESLGWGFQLQSPPVVALLALLMFALALNLSGVFEIGLSLTRLGSAGAGGGYGDSLLTGGLAVLVAAPCTAPFMGAALGFALVQPPIIGLLVFTALGIGLALPFVVLASAPRLLRFLPRPGPWLETLKQLFAFPLYATVVWLLWVLGQQAGVNALAIVLLAMIAFAMGAWLWARGVRTDRALPRLTAVALMLVAVGVSVGGSRNTVAPSRTGTAAAAETLDWQPWSASTVRDLRATGRPVFVDFTAAWCLSCQVNERVALRTDAVTAAFRDANVALVRADWTSRDDGITQVLASFGRSGVPLYVLYPAASDAAPVILPAVLTPGMVVNAVRSAASPTVAARAPR